MKRPALARLLRKKLICHLEFGDFQQIGWWPVRSPRPKIGHEPDRTVWTEAEFNPAEFVYPPTEHQSGGGCVPSTGIKQKRRPILRSTLNRIPFHFSKLHYVPLLRLGSLPAKRPALALRWLSQKAIDQIADAERSDKRIGPAEPFNPPSKRSWYPAQRQCCRKETNAGKTQHVKLAYLPFHFLALLSISFPASAQQGLVPQEPPHTIERFQDMPLPPSEADLMAGLLLRYRGGIMTLSQPLPAVLEACDRYWGCVEFLPDGTCFIRAELVARPEWLPQAAMALDAFIAGCASGEVQRRGSVAAR